MKIKDFVLTVMVAAPVMFLVAAPAVARARAGAEEAEVRAVLDKAFRTIIEREINGR